MSSFTLLLQDAIAIQSFDKVTSFVARDNSGSFGVQAGHETLITCLKPGLARFRQGKADWIYIAQPGAVLLFQGQQLAISATQFIVSKERDALIEQMETQWRINEETLDSTKRNISQVEQLFARKLLEISRQGRSS